MKQLYTLTIAALLSCCSGYAQDWQRLGAGSNALRANNYIHSLRADNGEIYAGGSFRNADGYFYVAKWNGAFWEELGGGENSLKATVPTYAVWVDKSHNVYTLWNNALNKHCIVKWDGATWSELGSGDSALNPNNAILDICTDKNGNVYAAGEFTDTTGSRYVAKWDGITWSELGTGSSALNAGDRILTLAADSHGNIYAAGCFMSGGYAYVAKWDGTTWHGVGAADVFNGMTIQALYVDAADNIYAGGWFRNAEGRPYVAKWDGAVWQELGSGGNALNAEPTLNIHAITGDNMGNIYAAGLGIKQADGKECVKRWNGSGWSTVGTGSSALNANGSIWAVCTDAAGSVYAGGNFTDGATQYDGYKYVAKYVAPSEVTNAIPVAQLQAWPNPAHDALYVQGTGDDGQYLIYDITGSVKITTYHNASMQTKVIDISALSAGNYILRSSHYVPFFFNKN